MDPLVPQREMTVALGDIFYDAADSTCGDTPANLGWVRVEWILGAPSSRGRRPIYVRPVVGPGPPLFYRPVSTLSSAAREGAIVVGRSGSVPSPVGAIFLEGQTVWQWDYLGAATCKTASAMRHHGHKVKAAYNTHNHTFTCHKYKDAYKAKFCRMGFGRRAMPSTTFTMVRGSHTFVET